MDTTAGMGLDAGDIVVAFGALTLLADGVWESNRLTVDGSDDFVGLLNLGSTSTGNAALGGELDFGLGKDDLELDVVSSNILGQNSPGVFARAISSQEMVAALGDAGVDLVDNVVKAGNALSFQLTGCCKQNNIKFV